MSRSLARLARAGWIMANLHEVILAEFARPAFCHSLYEMSLQRYGHLRTFKKNNQDAL
jgi:hypothetical protein